MRRCQCFCDFLRRIAARRMSPPLRADGVTIGIRSDVEDNVVVTGRANAAGQIVEMQRVADFPGDDVVGAGSVAADADRSEQRITFFAVEGEAAAKDIYTPAFLADQGVVRLAVILGWPFVRRVGIDRITVLQAEQGPTR